MWKNKKILVVIPARGGSKGVPLKNIYPINGKPLLAYLEPVMNTMPEVDKVVVSTDSKEIAEVAVKCGFDVPFFRPMELSGDQIGDWDVLSHSLIEAEKFYKSQFDIVLYLQPTSPMRKAEHLRAVLEKLDKENCDAVWTVSPTDLKFHPFKQLKLDGSHLSYFDEKGKSIFARQQLNPLYHRNGVAYAFTRSCLLEQKTIFGKNTQAVVIKDPLVNIDSMEDIRRFEDFIAR